MIVSELIEFLSQLNPEAKVRIAYQPSWPMWESVTAVQAGTESGSPVDFEGSCSHCLVPIHEHDDDECDGREEGAEILTADSAPAVYLVGGGSNHYASKALWDNGGW